MLLRPWSTVHDGSNGALLFARQPVARAVRGTVAPENTASSKAGLYKAAYLFRLPGFRPSWSSGLFVAATRRGDTCA